MVLSYKKAKLTPLVLFLLRFSDILKEPRRLQKRPKQKTNEEAQALRAYQTKKKEKQNRYPQASWRVQQNIMEPGGLKPYEQKMGVLELF